MKKKMNVSLVNDLLLDFNLSAYIEEDTCEESWITLSPEFDLNLYLDQDDGAWKANVHPVLAGGNVDTSCWLTVDMNTGFVSVPSCEDRKAEALELLDQTVITLDEIIEKLDVVRKEFPGDNVRELFKGDHGYERLFSAIESNAYVAWNIVHNTRYSVSSLRITGSSRSIEDVE